MNTDPTRRISPAIKLILTVMILIPLAGSAWFLYSVHQASRITTDPADYALAFGALPDSAQEIFPHTIPGPATGVVFYYRPYGAPGGMMLQVRFNAGVSFEELQRGVAPPATALASRPNPPPAIRSADNAKFEDLPADFAIWHYSQSAGDQPGTVMAAGSPARREIVYSFHE